MLSVIPKRVKTCFAKRWKSNKIKMKETLRVFYDCRKSAMVDACCGGLVWEKAGFFLLKFLLKCSEILM
jgi:hypothetical protein